MQKLSETDFNLTTLIAAAEEAAKLDALVQESPLRDELQPALSAACDEIDAALVALELTPEYEFFADKMNALSVILGETLQKLENS